MLHSTLYNWMFLIILSLLTRHDLVTGTNLKNVNAIVELKLTMLRKESEKFTMFVRFALEEWTKTRSRRTWQRTSVVEKWKQIVAPLPRVHSVTASRGHLFFGMASSFLTTLESVLSVNKFWCFFHASFNFTVRWLSKYFLKIRSKIHLKIKS